MSTKHFLKMYGTTVYSILVRETADFLRVYSISLTLYRWHTGIDGHPAHLGVFSSISIKTWRHLYGLQSPPLLRQIYTYIERRPWRETDRQTDLLCYDGSPSIQYKYAQLGGRGKKELSQGFYKHDTLICMRLKIQNQIDEPTRL